METQFQYITEIAKQFHGYSEQPDVLFATINLNFKYSEHRIRIRTVNLNSNWKNISSRLKEIIGLEKTVNE